MFNIFAYYFTNPNKIFHESFSDHMLNCLNNCHKREKIFLISDGIDGFYETKGFKFVLAIGHGLLHIHVDKFYNQH